MQALIHQQHCHPSVRAWCLAVVLAVAAASCVDAPDSLVGDESAELGGKADGAAFPKAVTITAYSPHDPSQALLSEKVQQQPAANPGYVTSTIGYVTEFSLARNNKAHAFLAHNHKDGQYFFDVIPADVIDVAFADLTSQPFVVTEILRFRALQPLNPYSDFIEIDEQYQDKNQIKVTAASLFAQTYAVPGRTLLQTCIENMGNLSWGRLFVIAKPLDVCHANLVCYEWDGSHRLLSTETACRQTADRASPILACRTPGTVIPQ